MGALTFHAYPPGLTPLTQPAPQQRFEAHPRGGICFRRRVSHRLRFPGEGRGLGVEREIAGDGASLPRPSLLGPGLRRGSVEVGALAFHAYPHGLTPPTQPAPHQRFEPRP